MSRAPRRDGRRAARWLCALLSGAAVAGAGCTPSPNDPPHASLARLWRAYQEMEDERAIALAGDPRRRWVAGLSAGEATPEDAERTALIRCREQRAARRLQVPCRLYAVGDEVVWQEW